MESACATLKLPSFLRNSAKIRVRNRCEITDGRALYYASSNEPHRAA